MCFQRIASSWFIIHKIPLKTEKSVYMGFMVYLICLNLHVEIAHPSSKPNKERQFWICIHRMLLPSQEIAGQQLEENQISNKTQTALNIDFQEWKSIPHWWVGSITLQILNKLQAWDLKGWIFTVLYSLSRQVMTSSGSENLWFCFGQNVWVFVSMCREGVLDFRLLPTITQD